MNDLSAQIHRALQSVSEYKNIEPDSYSTTRLGGLTNLVFKLEPQTQTARESMQGNIVVRIPGQGTEEYIDRSVEAHNARLAADAGVSAEIIRADPVSGVLISRYIENSVTMSAENFLSRTDSPVRAGKAFRNLHQSGKKFKFHFELFSMIDDYLTILASKTLELPEGYNGIVKAAEPVKTALLRNPSALAPCHCDPLCENFLDDGDKMWIIDWEYSGMNDPLWDLGDLCVEGEFNREQEHQMLTAYCNGEPDKSTLARVLIYKAMCDLLWTLWGLIQHANNNPADDFWAYATTRFDRCKALMNTREFNEAVRLVAK